MITGSFKWKQHFNPELPVKQIKWSEMKMTNYALQLRLRKWPYNPQWHPIQKWYTLSHQAVGHQVDRLSSQTGSQWHKLHQYLSASTKLWRCSWDKSQSNFKQNQIWLLQLFSNFTPIPAKMIKRFSFITCTFYCFWSSLHGLPKL